ncbi:hypothetical protein [Adhaeretor mobilis]|uniref:Uncharacterized protein n=1 Tax=Adhaeretor mobilis TaxID=1930276 RepID=A0A517MZ13_9BACT|nr:hypothetical protein [Adhaeretor mobilis]QDT00110.1 hypothetical protein HG15A2_34450 [Adhaeretor mobilis]
MGSPFHTTVENLDSGSDLLRWKRYGVIVARNGTFEAVHLKAWPKLIAWPEIWPVGSRYHVAGTGDACWLYYNQPRRFSNFLAVKYMVSTRGASLATCQTALRMLDQIAEIKRTDAILCDVTNSRLSDRLLQRFGWEAHRPQRWHRNFIKRFYGSYPGSCQY